MFNDNTIKRRVMEVIDKKVKDTQLAYDEGVRVLEEKLVEDKGNLADKMVNDLIGKII